VSRFAIDVDGDFSLAAAGEFLRGFKPAAGGASAQAQSLSLGFLLDRTFEPVAVALEQRERRITGEASGPAADVKAQVERMLSLDVDARGWLALGRKDPVVGGLQERYRGFRAVCFPSPYEAALWGILAQRVSMSQASRMKEALARAHGSVLTAGGAEVLVPPPPPALLELDGFAGIPDQKLVRMRGIAEAALDGRLDAARLRALPEEAALAELSALRGVGAWTAAHILYRGAGVADAEVGPNPAPTPPGGVAVCRPTSRSKPSRSRRSMTRPPSVVLCPAAEWPPLRTASSSPEVRATSMTRATSSGPFTRAIAAGRRSMPPTMTIRAAS